VGLEKYYYKRIFIENITNCGRFYSKFTNIPKVERKKLILDSLNYVEIDFTAFVPNTMKIFVDGECYEKRPYNEVSKFIVKINTKIKKKK